MTTQKPVWKNRYIDPRQIEGSAACDQAVHWLVSETVADGVCDLALAWDRCERSDWMLWALERTPAIVEAHRPRLARLAIDWADRVQPPTADQRFRDALAQARKSVEGAGAVAAGDALAAVAQEVEATTVELAVAWGMKNMLLMDPVRRTEQSGDEEAERFAMLTAAEAVETALAAVADPAGMTEAARRSVLAAAALAGAAAEGDAAAGDWDQARDRERRQQADDLRESLPNPWRDSEGP